MKIKETLERECCDFNRDDIRPYRGKVNESEMRIGLPRDMKFCRHCGQVYGFYRVAGDMEATYHPLEVTRESKGA